MGLTKQVRSSIYLVVFLYNGLKIILVMNIKKGQSRNMSQSIEHKTKKTKMRMRVVNQTLEKLNRERMLKRMMKLIRVLQVIKIQ